MKLKFLTAGIFIILLFTGFKSKSLSQEYEIEDIFKGIDPVSGTMVLTDNDELEEAELILMPITPDEGTYSVALTRKADDLFKIEGKNIYIKTRYYYEYPYSESAILKVESKYGYTKGKIIF